MKGFGVVNKAEVVVFLELFWFFGDPTDVGNLIPVPALEICIYYPGPSLVIPH